MAKFDVQIANLTKYLKNKLMTLEMTIKDVIREVEEDDTDSYEVIRCYELNQQINRLKKLNKVK